jgi:hypothetical protein
MPNLITWFLDFVHRSEFQKLGTITFRKVDVFQSSGEGTETPTLLGPDDGQGLETQ